MPIDFISAHQPSFMPWLGYLHRIAISNVFIVLDDVQLEKNSYTNRNIIENKSTKSYQWLTVPLLVKGHISNTIKDIKINKNTNWKRKHIATLKQEYNGLPFFNERFDSIKKIYDKDHIFFSELNSDLLKYLLNIFSIKTEIHMQSDLKIKGNGTKLITSICSKFGIKNFIFGIEGKNYVDRNVFFKEKCQAFEHQYNCKYSELKTHNQNNLSCLDLIFRYDKEQLNEIMFKKNNSQINLIL